MSRDHNKKQGNKYGYLACYKIADYPLYRQHWLLFVSVHANTIPAV